MSGRVRRATLIGGFVALVVLLPGCIKLNMNLGVNSDDTVSGTIQLGVQKELLDLTGQSADDLLGSVAPFPSEAPGVTVEPFDDGEFAGEQFTFEDVPLADFNSGSFAGATGPDAVNGGGDSLHIERQGDTFVVTGVLDLSSGLSGATGPFGGTVGSQFFQSADLRISFTFPGEVIEANGQVDGNTVTYVPTFGERLEIAATGSAIDNGQAGNVIAGGSDDSNLLLILVIAGAVVVLLVIVLLVLRSRWGKGGGGPQTGFGEPGPSTEPTTAAAPEVAGMPPADPTGLPSPTPPPPPVPPPPES